MPLCAHRQSGFWQSCCCPASAAGRTSLSLNQSRSSASSNSPWLTPPAPRSAPPTKQHAAASYRELHNNYIPQVNTGAGLGYSYGFPLALEGSAPSLFNINTQSALLNPSSARFRARRESRFRRRIAEEQRPAQPDHPGRGAQLCRTREMGAAPGPPAGHRGRRQQNAGRRRRARERRHRQRNRRNPRPPFRPLACACASPRRRAQPTCSANISPNSPAFPPRTFKPTPTRSPRHRGACDSQSGSRERKAASNPQVEAAVEHARAQYLRAQGEHKALWPSVDFAAQYALLSRFNNFQNYYIPSRPCTAPTAKFCA